MSTGGGCFLQYPYGLYLHLPECLVLPEVADERHPRSGGDPQESQYQVDHPGIEGLAGGPRTPAPPAADGQPRAAVGRPAPLHLVGPAHLTPWTLSRLGV